MTFPPSSRTGLAVVMLAAFSSQAMGGSEAVDPAGPIFIPPVFGAPAPPTARPAAGPDADAEPGEASGAAAADEQQTARATRAFSDAQFLCASGSVAEYRVDCLADQLAQYAADLPKTPEFSEARQIVAQTATKLNGVARRNASKTKRPARLREAKQTAPRRSSRPITPVADDRVAAANTEATAILREAETMLLRAAERSERRKVAFAQVAEAVGTSTVLLRSS